MDEATKAALESGRPVTVFNIGSVGQMNPAATTVTNNYYGDQFAPKQETAEGEAGGDGEDPALKTQRVVNASQKLTRKGKQDQPFKPTEATYIYVFHKDKPNAIALLYSALMGKKWLEEHTKLETFEKLFSGETGAFTIRWNLDTTQLLWYLFKRLKALNYITRPKGITKWQIEKSHILSKQGRQIDDWHGQHDPTDTTEVDTLVDLLNPQDAILAKSYRQEDRLNGDINRRLARERLMANRHHDDDDD